MFTDCTVGSGPVSASARGVGPILSATATSDEDADDDDDALSGRTNANGIDCASANGMRDDDAFLEIDC